MPTIAPTELTAAVQAVVAIKRVDGGRLHIGLAYRPDQGAPLRLVHLGWHHDLRDHELDSAYRCAQLAGLPPLVGPTLVMKCKLTAKELAKNRVAYGFGWRPGSVTQDENGVLTVAEAVSGLTCATFVLALLDLVNYTLVDLASWEDRDGDEAWTAWVLDMLKQTGASEAHIEKVRTAAAGELRVRPDDVAGAASVSKPPASFADATSAGAHVRADFGLI